MGRHLIIGAGHMGTKHGEILKKLDQEVEYVDLEFDPTKYERNHDSVLICTPAETHERIINSLPDMPIFCEKPIITSLNQEIAPKTISLAANNWRWCEHIKDWKWMNLIYENKSPYRNLDIIHFWHLFEEKRVHVADDPSVDDWVSLNGKIAIAFRSGCSTFCNGKQIHKKECDMFKDQMKHWLEVVKGSQNSSNPFEDALRDTKELLKQLGDRAAEQTAYYGPLGWKDV